MASFKVTSESPSLRSLLETVALFAPFAMTIENFVPAPQPPNPTDPVEEPPAPNGAVRYVSASGTGDGTTSQKAANVSKINEMILLAGANGVVEMVGDFPGSAIRVNAAPSSFVTVRGGNFTGARFAWSLPETEQETNVAGKPTGSTLFIIQAGAKNLRFQGQKVRDVGCVFDMSNVAADNLEFIDIEAVNFRDGFLTNEGSTITNVLIKNFKGTGFSKKGIRFHGKCAGWKVINPQLNSGWQAHDNFAVGIEMYDTAHDILIDGGYTLNCRDTQGGSATKYWNGDGITAERGVKRVVIRYHRSAGHTDGGFDLKSTETTVENCVSADNKRNYRVWGSVTIRACESGNPRKRGGSGGFCHIWGGNTAKVTAEAFTAIGPGLLAENDGADFVRINGLTLRDGATDETKGAVQIS